MNRLTQTIDQLKELVRFPSVSSTSNRAISDWVAERLETLGFEVEQSKYADAEGIEKVNVVGKRNPMSSSSDRSPGLAYFAHTDVVPAVGWTGPGGDPFDPVVTDDRFYARGACDMKGSLATMLSAAGEIDSHQQTAPLWIVCTADEEVGFIGAKHLVKHSNAYRDLVRSQPISVIGEPTRLKVVHAHKGIVALRMTSIGKAAHSSTLDGVNSNRNMVPMLQMLRQIEDRCMREQQFMDDRFDPPTLSWNYGVSDGATAVNITPDRSVAWVSLRPMPTISGEELIREVQTRAEELGLSFQQFEGGFPLWIDSDATCIRQFCELAESEPETVCYGTDGGEFQELHHRLVFGPGDIAQAHTTDEWIALDQLHRGGELFAKAVKRWCVA